MNNILNCNKCKVFERKDPKPPLCNIMVSEPMDLEHIDLLGLETTMNTKVCSTVVKILVITDHFSCHMQAYKVEDKRAVTIAKCLYDNYFRHYGFPRLLMSDQGKEFCNNILKEMCYYLNIKKIPTMPYHPQSNGSIKRVHYTLRRMIGKLDNKRCKNWVDHLATIIHAYNMTSLQITVYSPYFLLMGCRPRLPVDLLFPTSRQLPKIKNVNEYVKVLHRHLHDAICTARISADQEAAWHKRLYDQRARVAELHPGDKVLVKLDVYQGARRKLVNWWSSTLHTVVRCVADDVPAYVIENAKGDRKVIHWARLLLWSSCDDDQEGLQMTVDQLTIFVSLSALEPLPEGEKRCRVSYKWSITRFGLNLAVFKPMLEVSELKTGPEAPVMCTDMLQQEGVGQQRKLGEKIKSMGDGNTVLVEDTRP